MTAWTADELARIGGADELQIAPRRSDGTLRPAVPIWVVRVDDELYVRSWRGFDRAWYRAARARGAGYISAGGIEHDVTFKPVRGMVDDAYHKKYARYASYLSPMIGAQARATTLRLEPEDGS